MAKRDIESTNFTGFVSIDRQRADLKTASGQGLADDSGSRRGRVAEEAGPEGCVGLVPGPREPLDGVAAVEQHDHGLAEHDGQPEDDVARLRRLEPVRQLDERHLRHHAGKGKQAEVAEGDADNELVHHSRDEKDDQSNGLAGPASAAEWAVHVLHHPRVDREVPAAPEVAHRGGVPPITVELAIPEADDLSQNVEVEVEDAVEAQHPHDEVGYRDLEQALGHEDEVPVRLPHLHRSQRVDQPRDDVLDGDEVDGGPNGEKLHHTPPQPPPPHALRPRVVGGKDKGRGGDEVGQLAHRRHEALVFAFELLAELRAHHSEGEDLHHSNRRVDKGDDCSTRLDV
eukprot:CAMPEP_0113705062 /NCGR_PEP_ID=MMETSP0038_2-20120614/26906_1 /TAXON_ID=2898 /ORGANISM="Cryptomonas paramecium" /LENGTH=341 /DNA_ID=CAMNT_0000629993 /DNA_START=471 /DNA_END=1497 /DNA_ORIENTATION=- /assembly_acc=CAM_ASM_000170